jgi:predicted amidophosphoribosyltransferase
MIRWWTAVHGLVDLLFPLCCAGCGVPGVGWCPECAGQLGGLRRLRRPLLVHGPPAYALGHYHGAARKAVVAYKESGRRDMAEPFGRLLATGVRSTVGSEDLRQPTWLVPAPSRAIASRRRGGPHMRRVAMHAAAALSESGWTVSVADCLAMVSGVRDSTGLTPAQRVRNLARGLSVRHRLLPPRDGRVVLIDDVITTGATVAGCVRELDGAGVRVAVAMGLTATGG